MDRTEGTLTTKAEMGIMQSEAKECGSHHKTEQARERFFLKASQGGLVFGSSETHFVFATSRTVRAHTLVI